MLQRVELRSLLATKPRVFVTGGGGFIGSAVVGRLAALDIPLQVLTGAPNDEVKEPPPHVASGRAEITDFDSLCEMSAGCEIMVHIAGPASVGESFHRPTQYASIHVQGTATALDACRKMSIRRFVQISSAEIYGRVERQPISETQRPDPRSPYAAAKLGAEHMVRAFANTFEIEACIVRPFSVYGPGQSGYALVPTILRQALSADAIVLADLKSIRDYCYVDDVVDAILLACDFDRPGVAEFNVGTGVGTSVAQLASAVLEHVGRSIPIVTGAPHLRPRSAEIFELVADVRRAKDILKWEPRTSLSAGLQRLVKEMRG